MIFNSTSFLLFLITVTTLYWILPRTARLWLILLSSLTFYGFWRIEFAPLMLFSAFVDYSASIGISKAVSSTQKKLFLILSIVTNLGLLFYFKYLYFFAENITNGLNVFGFQIKVPVLDIILPLGISFYTFQTISYTVDVYRGLIKPERNFILYSCYVTFFPQLIAGPILRAKEVIHQFKQRPRFDVVELTHGVRWVLYGLFLKVVIADNIAPLVDNGFSQPLSGVSALDVWTLAFLFGFQIYFDFSAYSHIAIGSARMMGLHFPDNFHYPYLAHSPKEFWRRWHISLSSWIRDYLYLPLAGFRVEDRSTGGLAVAVQEEGRSPTRNLLLVLFLTWAIMGLWHGANWTFVIWGVYHATFIALYRMVSPIARNWPELLTKLIGWSVTLPIVMLGWIPFRAQSLSDAAEMLAKIFSIGNYSWLGMRENTYLVTALLLVLVISTYHIRKIYSGWSNQSAGIRIVMESIGFTVIIGLVFVFLRPINQFIYFQF